MIGDITDFSKKPNNYYEDTREEILKHAPKDAKTTLEFGYGLGRFAAVVKKNISI